jgi:hypothetical protein
MFKDDESGQTHSFNDGCGEPAHNDRCLNVDGKCIHRRPAVKDIISDPENIRKAAEKSNEMQREVIHSTGYFAEDPVCKILREFYADTRSENTEWKTKGIRYDLWSDKIRALFEKADHANTTENNIHPAVNTHTNGLMSIDPNHADTGEGYTGMPLLDDVKFDLDNFLDGAEKAGEILERKDNISPRECACDEPTATGSHSKYECRRNGLTFCILGAGKDNTGSPQNNGGICEAQALASSPAEKEEGDKAIALGYGIEEARAIVSKYFQEWPNALLRDIRDLIAAARKEGGRDAIEKAIAAVEFEYWDVQDPDDEKRVINETVKRIRVALQALEAEQTKPQIS